MTRRFDWSATLVSKVQAYAAVACALLALSAVPGGPQVPQHLWDLWRIARAPAVAAGVVTGLDCPNHGRVAYLLRLEGTDIAGRRHTVGDVECRSLKIGQQLAIYYEPSAPENNAAFVRESGGNPTRQHFWTGLVTWSAFFLLAPAFLMFLVSVATRLTQRQGR